MNGRSSRAARLVRYVLRVRDHGHPTGYEVVAAAYARDNVALCGWDIAGAAYHGDVGAAESMAVRNLQRTLAETEIRATVVPLRG